MRNIILGSVGLMLALLLSIPANAQVSKEAFSAENAGAQSLPTSNENLDQLGQIQLSRSKRSIMLASIRETLPIIATGIEIIGIVEGSIFMIVGYRRLKAKNPTWRRWVCWGAACFILGLSTAGFLNLCAEPAPTGLFSYLNGSLNQRPTSSSTL